MSFYGTITDANAYQSARGRADWAELDEDEREAAMTRASDYVDQRYQYPGRKSGGRSQERQWPRTGATDCDGELIPDNDVPSEVERATYEAAYREAMEPGSLMPDYVPGRLVTREKVGPLEVAYATGKGGADGNPMLPVVSAVDDILSCLVKKSGPAIGVWVV